MFSGSMEVKERIIVESGILFGKYGIRSMTMDALAEEMGISKRTIYEKFRDKDTLLLEVIEYYREKRTREAHLIIEESENVIVAMFSLVKIIVSQIEQMNPLFFHDVRKYHTRVYRQLFVPGAIRDFSITEKLLSKGVEQKVFRDDFNPEIVSRTLHSLFDLFGHESSLLEAGYNRKQLFDNCIIPFLRGISTAKGVALIEENKRKLDH
jgi:AcrR family transcriptional regulator